MLCLLALWGRSAVAEEEAPGSPPAPAPVEQPTAKPPAVDPMVIRTCGVTAASVVDGDTLRPTGAKASVRILGLDTEETFRKDKDREAAAADFAAYAKAKRGDKPRPVKYGTPAGEAADALLADVSEQLGGLQSIPCVRIGNCVRYSPDALKAYISGPQAEGGAS